MTHYFTKLTAAFGFLVLAALTTSASASTYNHIDQLAVTVARQARTVVSETRHYRHTPEYRHLRSDAIEIARLADHMHEVAHHHGSLAHLESDLAQLDAKFHHLESVFDRIERNAAVGHGHIHGNTAHVRRLLCSMEDNLHHLQDDVRALRRASHGVHRVPVVRQPAVTFPSSYGSFGRPHGSHGYNSWGHGSPWGHSNAWGHGSNGFGHGRQISIGGGSSRFTFRF
ncbi:MAG: hypothetical protein HKN47_22515 [Pirellulaceae bacterium]|nr:hypothetical protein [Pirellulaceae bacterium]